MLEEKKRFLSNSFFLSIMQIVNIALPLLTIPFLIRVLGVEVFGLLAFSTSFMVYFIVVSDYGFNLTATREISIHQHNIDMVSKIYSSVIFIKIFLIFICFVFLVLLILFFPFFYENRQLHLISFLVVIGQSLFPVWFFQGMEAMKYIMFLNVFSKVFFTFGVFFVVSDPDDYLWVPGLTAIGLFFVVIFSLFYIYFKYKIKINIPSVELIRTHLNEGWYVFLSQIKITLFSSTNVVILGMISGSVAVGYYVAAEKIMRTLALIQTPITNALFPIIAKKMPLKKKEAIFMLKKVLYIGAFFYVILIGFVYLFSDDIILLIYGSEMSESIWILKMILIVPLFIFINNIFGTQILLNTGREKTFFYVLLFSALLSLTLCVTLVSLYSYRGAAMGLLITEFFIVFCFSFFVRKDFFND